MLGIISFFHVSNCNKMCQSFEMNNLNFCSKENRQAYEDRGNRGNLSIVTLLYFLMQSAVYLKSDSSICSTTSSYLKQLIAYCEYM